MYKWPSKSKVIPHITAASLQNTRIVQRGGKACSNFKFTVSALRHATHTFVLRVLASHHQASVTVSCAPHVYQLGVTGVCVWVFGHIIFHITIPTKLDVIYVHI